MDMFKHVDFTDRGTDNILPFVIESDDDNCKKTHYSDILDLGPEYKYDEYVCKGIQSLMAAKARRKNKREVTTWMAFRGNTRDLGSFREEIDEITDLHQILEEVLVSEHGDGVACIKQRRHDLSGDGVWILATASQRMLRTKVMSTPSHIDSETISQTDGARNSQVHVPLSDDPYMAVRQPYLATITDSESEPFEDSRETKIPQPLSIAPSPVPPSDDPYLIVRHAHTPATTDTESEPEEAPLETEEFEAFESSNTRITLSHSTTSSNSTTPLSSDHLLSQTSLALTRVSYYRSTAHMVVRTQPTLSLGMSARIAEAAALSSSSFRKRYRSSYEMPSPSSSLTLPIRKRYQGTSELVEDTEYESLDLDTEGEGSEDGGPSSEDEGPSLEEEEEATPEGQHQAVLVVDIAVDEPLGLGYEALRCRELALGEGSVPSTFEIGQSSRSMSDQQRVEETPAPRPRTPPSPEWLSSSLPVSPSSPAVPTPIASPTTTPAAIIAVDEDEFLEVGVQLELHRSILHDHIQHLDALPPILFKGYDRDLREFYTRSREVRHEIFSQPYRLRNLEQE
ncbi:hypothetical protein Tco_1113026 [Tanacetum coccineum]|uniref:Uncharacterized protein n=1 Tax=Tanacetum coccineum TaxID=301880 RepID=A0ABQ5IU10_9ASTR